MIRLRAPLSFLMALVLALTLVAAGVARGQVGDSGGLVICSGSGVVVLPVNPADPSAPAGSPAGPTVRLCPDCVATAFAGTVVPPAVVPAPVVWRMVPFSPPAEAVAHAGAILYPPARGPPVPV